MVFIMLHKFELNKNYFINLSIEHIQLNINFECTIGFELRMGFQKEETHKIIFKPNVKGNKVLLGLLTKLPIKIIQQNQSLSLQIKAYMFIDQKQKSIGDVLVDLSDLKEQNKVYEKNIQNCPDKNALIFLKVNFEENKGLNQQEQIKNQNFTQKLNESLSNNSQPNIPQSVNTTFEKFKAFQKEHSLDQRKNVTIKREKSVTSNHTQKDAPNEKTKNSSNMKMVFGQKNNLNKTAQEKDFQEQQNYQATQKGQNMSQNQCQQNNQPSIADTNTLFDGFGKSKVQDNVSLNKQTSNNHLSHQHSQELIQQIQSLKDIMIDKEIRAKDKINKLKETLETKNEELLKYQALLEQQAKTIKDKMSESFNQQKDSEKKEEIKELKKQIESLQSQLEKNQQENQQKNRVQIFDNKEELQELKIETNQKQKEMSIIIEQQKKQIELYRQETEQLNMKIEQDNQQKNQYESLQFNQEEKNQAIFKQQIDSLKNSLENAKKQISEKEEQNLLKFSEYKSDINKIKELQLNQYKLKLENLTKEYESLKKQKEIPVNFQTVLNENEKLKNQLNEMQKEMLKLSLKNEQNNNSNSQYQILENQHVQTM